MRLRNVCHRVATGYDRHVRMPVGENEVVDLPFSHGVTTEEMVLCRMCLHSILISTLSNTNNINDLKDEARMSAQDKIVIAFDAYGTLLSTESIADAVSKHIGREKAASVAQIWRKHQLEYTWRLNSMGQ